MKDLMEKITDQLKNATKIVFMGLGEEKLSDDGVGPYIISELLSYSNDNSLCSMPKIHYLYLYY